MPRLSEADLAAIAARAEQATPGPWTVYEDDLVWQLFAERNETFTWTDEKTGQEQSRTFAAHPWQLIKAPKQGSRYTEYWPGNLDSDFIAHARTDIPVLLANLADARSAFNRWPTSPGDPPFDGQPCPMDPWQVRNLFACAHNLTVAEYGSERFIRKLADLRRAVELVQPLVDAHFADSKHAHMATRMEEKSDG